MMFTHLLLDEQKKTWKYAWKMKNNSVWIQTDKDFHLMIFDLIEVHLNQLKI